MKWTVIWQEKPGRMKSLGDIEARTKEAATRLALKRVRAVLPEVDPRDVWVEEPRKPN